MSAPSRLKTKLRKGDPVIVISGGSKKVPIKGKRGKILKFVHKNNKLYAVIEGVNIRKKLVRANKAGEENRFIWTEFPVHISNVMYYSEKLSKPVRLKYSFREGKKIRGYLHPETKEFIEV